MQQPAPEEIVDTAPIISTSATLPLEPAVATPSTPAGETAAEAEKDVSISVEELKELNQVVQNLKADKDREALEELKEDREEYIEVSAGTGLLESNFDLC